MIIPLATITVVIAFIGLIVSCYAFYIDQKITAEATYKPACDLSDRWSCSKTILSPYGKLLGISNSIGGILFYSFLIALTSLHYYALAFYLTLAAAAVSIYFAYILLVKIKSLCPVCLSIYLVNTLLLICTFFLYRG